MTNGPTCTPAWPKRSKEEGFNQLAALFTMVAQIEKEHEERYRELAENLKTTRFLPGKSSRSGSAGTAATPISAVGSPEVPGLRTSPELL